MKHLLTVFTLLICTNLFAQHRDAELTIFFAEDKDFTVRIDGREYSRIYDELTVRNLDAGKVRIEIYADGYGPGGETNYEKHHRYEEVINLQRGAHTVAMFTRNRRLNIITGHRGGYEEHFTCSRCGGNHKEFDCRYEDFGYGNRLTSQKLSEIKNVISSKGFDETKQDIIEQVIDDYDVTGGDLKELLSLLSFESSKLETAKYALTRKRNIRDFYLVYDVFSFESSIQELRELQK